MFKLKANDTFSWPVKAKVPNGGKFETVKFEAVFKVLPQAEIMGLMSDDPEGGGLRVLDAALVSFSGIDVEDDDGDLVTDPDERKIILFKYPFFVSGVSDAFAAGNSGHRSKN